MVHEAAVVRVANRMDGLGAREVAEWRLRKWVCGVSTSLLKRWIRQGRLQRHLGSGYQMMQPGWITLRPSWELHQPCAQRIPVISSAGIFSLISHTVRGLRHGCSA